MKRLIISVALFFHCIVTFAQTQDLMSLSTIADSLYSAKNYKATLKIVDKILAKDAHNYEAYITRSLVYNDLGNDAKEEEALKKAVEVAPKELEVYQRYGGFLSGSKRLPDARDIYLQGIQHLPDNANLYADLASVYKRMNDDKKALEMVNKAIILDAKIPRYYFLRAYIFSSLNNNELALKSYTQSLELDSDPLTYSARADLKLKMKDYQGALADYTKAEELDSVTYKGAIEECKRKIGTAYAYDYDVWKEKDLAKALGYAREALKWPLSKELRAWMDSAIKWGTKELIEREQAAKDAIINKKLLTEAEIFRQRGIALIKAKKYQEAAQVLEKGMMVLIKSAELAIHPLYNKIYLLRKDCLAAVEEAKKKN
ncbi:tetratricopeptide repeat protein [Microscilla marina]|uniref:TPR repeat, putative n=1 Tax=Microscilla marina ATCC 23134 TaxID=313606 RepID=A1ZNJ4_MICM2|nr:tetratricopeptide repeat protein [Microscilla marina]EAY28105.1 TPR repeat, putative [Microscilla marina ATCC 23134]